MIILGLILLLLDFLILHSGILWIIGLILVIVGAVAMLVPFGGRRHRWY